MRNLTLTLTAAGCLAETSLLLLARRNKSEIGPTSGKTGI